MRSEALGSTVISPSWRRPRLAARVKSSTTSLGSCAFSRAALWFERRSVSDCGNETLATRRTSGSERPVSQGRTPGKR